MADRILILGASARAAAASARRAGMTPYAVDLFADADTERICEKVWRCPPDRYPDGLFELAKQAPPMPWMYTGGLENYPALVDALSRKRTLWGNGADKLGRVRDPFAVRTDYRAKLFAIPDLIPGTTPLPRDRTWVRKPVRGSGGGGVGFATPADAPSDRHFYQEYVTGEAVSVLFVAEDAALSRTTRKDRLWPYTIDVACFRQLVGTPWLHAGGFRYAGNVGPFPPKRFGLPGFGAGGLAVMNDVRTRLAGVFGADFVLTPDTAHLIEINPRYPASAELCGYAGFEPLTWLARCFERPDGLWRAKPPRGWAKVVGKGIYYAPHQIAFPASGPWDDSLARAADVWHRPDYADLPHPGDVIEPGQPVLTILAEAATEDDCLTRLQSRAADLDGLFGFVPSPLGGEG